MRIGRGFPVACSRTGFKFRGSFARCSPYYTRVVSVEEDVYFYSVGGYFIDTM